VAQFRTFSSGFAGREFNRIRARKFIGVTFEGGQMESRKPTVIIVDDHDFVLAKIRETIGEDFDVIAALNDGTSVAQMATQLKPDVVLMDICMPHLDGISAARECRRLGLPVKLVFLTVQEDQEYLIAATAMNAGYVLKHRMHLDLCRALHDALDNKVFVSPFSVLAPTK
jgi:DNA-binding NarL/FixJ family response regulator